MPKTLDVLSFCVTSPYTLGSVPAKVNYIPFSGRSDVSKVIKN